MLPITTIVKRIRSRVHDNDAVAYDDDEILDAINCGIRFIRRATADIRPSLLISLHEGILTAGTRSIVLEKRPTKIIHVTAGNKIYKTVENYNSQKVFHNYDKIWRNHNPIYTLTIKNFYSEKALRETEAAHVIRRGSDDTGEPKEFYLTGSQTINFVPIPLKDMKYTIATVDDLEELTLSDDSPLNTEFDDLLIEYATIRLSVGNEYNMTQETQLMSEIYGQIQKILMPPPAGFIVKGYWG